MSLSTHVLDTAAGTPAAGVVVVLQRPALDAARARAGSGVTAPAPPAPALGADEWVTVAEAVTDADGRVGALPADAAGRWRLVFDTATRSPFFPEASVTFVVDDPDRHLHVPLLLAPYGLTTYRGS
jgi:5-hydroxyisourate hydrolase